MKCFFTNKGHFHIGIVLIVAFLCVVGLWSLVQWQKENRVKENLAFMVNDIQTLSEGVVTDPADKERLNLIFAEMQVILQKYYQQNLQIPLSSQGSYFQPTGKTK